MKDFMTYIAESVVLLQQEEQELREDDRMDEANLVKIRINVYGIAKSFYETVQKIASERSFKEEYLRRIERLPQNWRASLEQAKAHEDVEKIVIEELKLQTLEDILAKFQEV